jgi:hypothetical protein
MSTESNMDNAAEGYRTLAGIEPGHVDEDANQKNVDAGVEHLGVNGPEGSQAQVTANEQRQRDELDAQREKEAEAEAKWAKEHESNADTAEDYEAKADKENEQGKSAPAKKSAAKKS